MKILLSTLLTMALSSVVYGQSSSHLLDFHTGAFGYQQITASTSGTNIFAGVITCGQGARVYTNGQAPRSELGRYFSSGGLRNFERQVTYRSASENNDQCIPNFVSCLSSANPTQPFYYQNEFRTCGDLRNQTWRINDSSDKWSWTEAHGLLGINMNFESSNIRYTWMSRANLTKANFSGVRARGLFLWESVLDGANFDNLQADYSGIVGPIGAYRSTNYSGGVDMAERLSPSMIGARFNFPFFRTAIVGLKGRGLVIENASYQISPSLIQECRLGDSSYYCNDRFSTNASELKLFSPDLTDARITRSNFDKLAITSTDDRNSVLRRTEISNNNIGVLRLETLADDVWEDINLSSNRVAHLVFSAAVGAQRKTLRFVRANLENLQITRELVTFGYIKFEDSNLSGLRMTQVFNDPTGLPPMFPINLRRAEFKGTTLRNASLPLAYFYGAKFDRVDFDGANFGGANFCRADMRGVSNLLSANLTNARMNDNTRLPAGVSVGQLIARGVRWNECADPDIRD